MDPSRTVKKEQGAKHPVYKYGTDYFNCAMRCFLVALFGLAFLLVSASASAYLWRTERRPSSLYGSANAACDGSKGGIAPTVASSSSSNPYRGGCYGTTPNAGYYNVTFTDAEAWCVDANGNIAARPEPNGACPSGTQACPVGQTLNNQGSCIVLNPCDRPPVGGEWSWPWNSSGSGSAFLACVSGCQVIPDSGGKCGHNEKGEGRCFANGLSFIGSACTASDSTASSGTSSQSCSIGQCLGQINSVNVCLPCSGTQSTPGVKGGANPANPNDPNTIKTGDVGVSGSSGNTGGMGSNGTLGGSSSTGNSTGTSNTGNSNTDPQPDKTFCQQNPNLSICKDSAWSGSCTQGLANYQCSGDAVQCAMARALAEQRCKFDQVDQQISDASYTVTGKQILSGNDPQSASLPSVQNAQFVQLSQTLDQSGFLSGGSCFVDKFFTLNGRSFVLPFSTVCPYLLPLRFLIMTIASIMSFYILAGVRTQGGD